jgi:hypothetical protein
VADEGAHPVLPGADGQLIGEAALADARLATDHGHAAAPLSRLVEGAEKLIELSLAAHEWHPSCRCSRRAVGHGGGFGPSILECGPALDPHRMRGG